MRPSSTARTGSGSSRSTNRSDPTIDHSECATHSEGRSPWLCATVPDQPADHRLAGGRRRVARRRRGVLRRARTPRQAWAPRHCSRRRMRNRGVRLATQNDAPSGVRRARSTCRSTLRRPAPSRSLSARRLPSLPRRSRSSGHRSRRETCSVISAVSGRSRTTPVRPSSTTSRTPPVGNVTTGHPAICASMATPGIPSTSLVMSRRSTPPSSRSTSGRCPRELTCSSSPRRRASCSNSARSGPSPTTTRCAV